MADVKSLSQEVQPQAEYTAEERAIELKKMMSAARHPDEKFDEYQVRRRTVNKMIKERLKTGTYVYENKFVPVAGTMDAETGEPKLRGVPYVKNA